MRSRGFVRRVLFAALSGMALALGLSFPANGLTRNEVEKVTVLLVGLAPELGPFAWDEEEADRWFDEDANWNGQIAAAGFTREGWKSALDTTFRGFLATIPEDIFSARLTAVFDGLEAMSHLSAEQRAEVRALAEEKIAEIRLLRAEGATFADVVRPYAARLDKVFETGIGDAE